MTLTVNAKKMSNMDPVFQDQVQEHQKQAQKEYDKRHTQDQYPWTMPQLKGWSGDLWDWEGMKEPFKREKANQDFVSATKDQFNPGVTGDLVITTTQIDYLAVMERAFRARHTYSWARAYAQKLGRRKGHGDPSLGLFVYGIIEYIHGLLKEASNNNG